MFEDIKEFILECIIPAFIITIFVFGIVFGIIYLIDKNVSCPSYSRAIDKNVKYDFWAGGCFVELDNGQYVQRMNYQGVTLE